MFTESLFIVVFISMDHQGLSGCPRCHLAIICDLTCKLIFKNQLSGGGEIKNSEDFKNIFHSFSCLTEVESIFKQLNSSLYVIFSEICNQIPKIRFLRYHCILWYIKLYIKFPNTVTFSYFAEQI